MPGIDSSSLETDIRWIKEALRDLSNKFEKFAAEYVRREEFDNVEKRITKIEKFFDYVVYIVASVAVFALIYLVAQHPDVVKAIR